MGWICAIYYSQERYLEIESYRLGIIYEKVIRLYRGIVIFGGV